MSIICSTSEQICHSPTNKSKTKMLFSFGRSSRFPANKQNQQLNPLIRCDKFYEINKFRQPRATAFGYGSKYDFTIDVPETPAPGQYESLCIFGQAKKNNKGFGFGSGRCEMESTGSLYINKNPGPGTYKPAPRANNIYSSLKGKGKIDNRQLLSKPGPGTYENISDFNKTGRTFFAKFKNKSACKFSKQEKLKIINNKVPGPGQYDMSKTEFSPEGKYFYSRLQSAKGNKFGKTLRLSHQNRCKTPGPGNYRLPTEFGYYKSKHAKKEERQDCKNNTISYDVQ